MSVLDCRDLSFAYEGRPVLSHVNFSLEKGSYLGIIGENGSGKALSSKGSWGSKNRHQVRSVSICRTRRRGWATCRSSRP